MSKRFIISDNGIRDKWRGGKKLSWLELCDTLNALDCICDKNHDEYEHIIRLEHENKQLKFQLKECREHKLFSRRELEKENEQLKKQLSDVDRLIDDLGHDEMRRQYEEIFKGDV